MLSSTEEEEDGETLYCICRSTDVNRFMIGCDHCEEWYHGDCIGVTEKDAKYIKKFYCKECREKNKHLKVVYKSKYADKMKEKELVSKDKEGDKKHKDKKKKKDKDKDRDRERDRKHKDEKDRHKNKHKDKDRDRDNEKERDNKEKEKEKERQREKDREREKMAMRQEIKTEKISSDIKIKEEKIKEEKKIKEEEPKSKPIEPPSHKRLEEVKRERSKSVDKKEPPEKQRKVLASKEIDNVSKYSSEDDWAPVPATSKPIKEKPAPIKRKASRDIRDGNKKRKGWRQARHRDSSDESDVEVDLTPRQCHGIDCINTARVNSKYCSDQCGLSLASLRIYQTLPERIREWNLTSCKAAETNQKELVNIRAEINTARDKLEEVDREVEKLEQLIAKVKKIAPIEKDSDDSSDEDEEKRGGTVPCISCGKDVSSKLAIRHMESCFNKFESKTSYGSLYKTNIEGYEMVCDFYNPQTGTYCKRLRAICPEHTKDPIIGENEVCGYPLTKDIFKPNGEYCRVKKKECNLHYCWEKLKRGELDMERVRCWMKLDELMEKERQEKDCMSRRAGVLNLMLHSTFNHEVMEKVIKMQQKGGGSGQGGAPGAPLKKQPQVVV